jgi:hypothetical protein
MRLELLWHVLCSLDTSIAIVVQHVVTHFAGTIYLQPLLSYTCTFLVESLNNYNICNGDCLAHTKYIVSIPTTLG